MLVLQAIERMYPLWGFPINFAPTEFKINTIDIL